VALFAVRCLVLWYTWQGSWLACLVLPFIDWIAGVNIFHDASHFALSTNWVINYIGMYLHPYFCSPTLWMHQHVIGHHNYTNLPERDPDLYHYPPWMRNTKTLRWKFMHGYQMYTWTIVWTLAVSYGMPFLESFKSLTSGYYLRWVTLMKMSRSHYVMHILSRALTFFLVYMLPYLLFPPMKATFFALYPIIVLSWLFMLSTQINHLTPENIDLSSTDYWKHQVITSHSFGHESKFSFLLTGGLNFQIEHHLFPSINHCHHKALSPKVKELCKKHGVMYNESDGVWSAFKKHLQHVYNLADKNLKEDQ